MDPDLPHLRHAARLALRGHGGAEPNPMVGCVIVGPDGSVAGWGVHRRFGGPHAEIDALRRAGSLARGGTVYLTLEPCNHVGKTGPCSEALIDAGVRRVVVAREDPNRRAAGGIARLREAGIEVTLRPEATEAAGVGGPFARRATTGLPWVIVKWAQTLDGRIATRTGESQWISGPASRRMVHRERGRVDVILTGIGTVRHDDPRLTARNVRVRRTARRVVVDPALEIPLESNLVRTAGAAPLTVACTEHALSRRADHAGALREAGTEVLAFPAEHGDLPLAPLLTDLASRHEVTTVLVEAGRGLVRRLLDDELANEAWVFVAPMLLGDDEAQGCVGGREAPRLADGIAMTLVGTHRRGEDVVLRYLVDP